jgi:hypothetical protein
MSLKSKKDSLQPTDNLRSLYLEPEDPGQPECEYFPFFYVEARIDFNDVRTQLRETVSLSRALEIYSNDAELLWVEDMIRDVDLQKTSISLPDSVRLSPLPGFVDAKFLSRMETKFVQYLLKSFAATVYRNYALNVYSFAGETRGDFARRCRELLDGPKRSELDILHDVFKRRLEQTKEKYLVTDEPLGLELADGTLGLEFAKTESQNKSVFFQYSERIDEHFLRGEIQPGYSPEETGYSPELQELEERLMSLELEALQEIKKLQDSYREKVGSLDEYKLHPNPKDIHFVRSGILWMPQKAA